MGSFEPDSTSSVAEIISRRWMPPTRRRKNTAAASVEPTMAPSSSPSAIRQSKKTWAARPMTPAVRPTPSVARTRAGAAARRNVLKRVRKPESKRMIARAMEPMK